MSEKAPFLRFFFILIVCDIYMTDSSLVLQQFVEMAERFGKVTTSSMIGVVLMLSS